MKLKFAKIRGKFWLDMLARISRADTENSKKGIHFGKIGMHGLCTAEMEIAIMGTRYAYSPFTEYNVQMFAEFFILLKGVSIKDSECVDG